MPLDRDALKQRVAELHAALAEIDGGLNMRLRPADAVELHSAVAEIAASATSLEREIRTRGVRID